MQNLWPTSKNVFSGLLIS